MKMLIMKKQQKALFVAALLATTAATPAFAQSPEEPAAAAGNSGSYVEEIVVTAQKREQNLQVVPVAVTALSTDTLQAVRFANVKDLNAVAPGLSVRENAGGNQAPVFSMRGVFGSTTYASEAGIALYVDGVYVNGNAGAQFDLANIERIEVLRGPQGTLFGRNAIGGAVNLISREPTGEFSVRQELTYGNLDQFRAKTSLELPQWGPLSASLTYLHNERRGDVRNLGAGTVWDFSQSTDNRYGKGTSPKYLGGQNVDAVTAAVKLEPGAGIKAVYRFSYSLNHYSPDATGYVYAYPFVEPILAGQDPAFMTGPSRKRPDAVNNWYTTTGTSKVRNHTITLSMPITDEISVRNITAFRKVHVDSTNQLDGLGGVLAAPNTPLLLLVNGTSSDQKTFSNEFQVNVNTDWFALTAGVLHFHSFTVEGGKANLTNASVFTPMPGFIQPGTGALPSRVAVDSDAIFVQNEIHLTDALDLVLGARLTRDKKKGTDFSATPFAPGIPIAYVSSTPSYLAGLNYRVNEHVFLYGKYSTAYISGGQFAGVSFDPATAKSWEAGIKSDLFDRRLRLNLALFTVKYGGVQVLTIPTNPSCIALGASITASQCIVNGGDARAKGVELEATLVPVEGLTLAGNLSYTHFKYTRLDPNLAPNGTFEPEFRPKWTGTVSAQYRSPNELIGGAHLVARADANYTSSQYGTPNSTAQLLALGKMPSAWIVNGRVGLTGFQIAGADVELAAWGKNLTNNRSMVYSADIGIVVDANYQRARAYGLDLNFSF